MHRTHDRPGVAAAARRLALGWMLAACAATAQGADTRLPGGFHAVDPPPRAPARPAQKAPPQARAWQRALDPFYDPANPAYDQLQRPAEALAGLPADARGQVDWMQALRSGRIVPRAALAGEAGMQVLDLDVILRNTRDMPYVRFPHRSHTEWLACGNCHPVPFEARAGATRATMNDIFRGRTCGVCHDRVAFVTYFACERCHSVPRRADGRLWEGAGD